MGIQEGIGRPNRANALHGKTKDCKVCAPLKNRQSPRASDGAAFKGMGTGLPTMNRQLWISELCRLCARCDGISANMPGGSQALGLLCLNARTVLPGIRYVLHNSAAAAAAAAEVVGVGVVGVEVGLVVVDVVAIVGLAVVGVVVAVGVGIVEGVGVVVVV